MKDIIGFVLFLALVGFLISPANLGKFAAKIHTGYATEMNK